MFWSEKHARQAQGGQLGTYSGQSTATTNASSCRLVSMLAGVLCVCGPNLVLIGQLMLYPTTRHM